MVKGLLSARVDRKTALQKGLSPGSAAILAIPFVRKAATETVVSSMIALCVPGGRAGEKDHAINNQPHTEAAHHNRPGIPSNLKEEFLDHLFCVFHGLPSGPTPVASRITGSFGDY